jgi:predicted RNA-binding protein YlxR (DUF448 family)
MLMRLAAPGPDQLQLEPHKGRGGYLHRDPNCQRAFVSRKGHYRAFHVEVSRKVKAEFINELATRNRE